MSLEVRIHLSVLMTDQIAMHEVQLVSFKSAYS